MYAGKAKHLEFASISGYTSPSGKAVAHSAWKSGFISSSENKVVRPVFEAVAKAKHEVVPLLALEQVSCGVSPLVRGSVLSSSASPCKKTSWADLSEDPSQVDPFIVDDPWCPKSSVEISPPASTEAMPFCDGSPPAESASSLLARISLLSASYNSGKHATRKLAVYSRHCATLHLPDTSIFSPSTSTPPATAFPSSAPRIQICSRRLCPPQEMSTQKRKVVVLATAPTTSVLPTANVWLKVRHLPVENYGSNFRIRKYSSNYSS